MRRLVGRARAWRPAARPRLILAAVFGFLLVAALLGDKGLVHLWRVRGDLDSLHRDVQALEAENARLSREIADLRDNPAVIERIAREELGLVRPDERVLRFPRSTATPAPAP